MVIETDPKMLTATTAERRETHQTSVSKARDPNRRPLLVDKVMFERMQMTQRLANGQPDFPNIDLALFGTAALRIVFGLENADQLIIEQALQDLAAKTKVLKPATSS
jgi:hypothetical protein